MTPREAHPNVLTIDGPAGVGKSSVARRVAARLGFFHLDTGAMYRTVALAALRRGVTASSAFETRLAPVLSSVIDEIVSGQRMKVGAGGTVWLDGEDVSQTIRGSAVTELVSPVAAVPAVRHALVEIQRRIGAEQSRSSKGVVVEGRDAGSHVFPDARWRFYLDASLRERARRRLKQDAGSASDAHQVTATMESLAQRDRIDRERTFAPLCIPDGATVLDTTHLSLEQVVAAICDEVGRG